METSQTGWAGPPLPPEDRSSARRNRFLTMVMAVLLVGVGAVVILPHLHRNPASPAQTPLAAPSPIASASTPSGTTLAPLPTEKLPPSKPRLAIPAKLISAGPAPSLPWPTSGQAKVEVVGAGVIGQSGHTNHAVPIASVTKVMTAYTVLRDHPLAAGQSGPQVVVSAAARLGMSSTHYADPHGLSSSTVSTVTDLLKLAPAAMAEPTLAQIAGTVNDSIPLNPNLKNVNSLLGLHGIYGIKTGSTTAAGGCLLFAAARQVSGHDVTIYGAVLGISGDRSSILSNARDASDALVVGAGDSLHRIVLLHAGTPLVTLVDKSGASDQLTVAKDLAVYGWSGQTYRFALPSAGHRGQAPTTLLIHTPTQTFSVRLTRI